MKMCRRLARELVAIMDELAAPHLEQENPMRTEPEQALALECLRLATNGFSEFPEATVERAKLYYEFVTGDPEQSARQTINAALDKAGVK